jgi:hypothetical protein
MKKQKKISFGSPHTLFKKKEGKMSFEVDIYGDGSGHLVAKSPYIEFITESGNIKEWIKEASESEKFYSNLEFFLHEVNEEFKREK